MYDTKPENVPPSLQGAIDAAEILRRYKQRGCLPDIENMSAWEFCCFDSAEEASDKIEAEAMKEASGGGEDKKGNIPSGSKQTPMGAFGVSKEGGAFKDW